MGPEFAALPKEHPVRLPRLFQTRRGLASAPSLAVAVTVALFTGSLPVVVTPHAQAAAGVVERALYPPVDGAHPEDSLAAADPGQAPVVERTETATVYARPDGWHQAVISSTPVNWQDPASGKWSAIDTRLVADGTGGFRNASGPASFRFAGATGEGSLLRVAAGDSEFGFRLEGATAGREAVVSGSSIIYLEVFAGIDLEYVVGPTSVKEVFVVKRPVPAALLARFRFALELSGLRAEPAKTSGGGLTLVDRNGRHVARLPDGTMDDASGRVGPVAVELEGGSNEVNIDVVPDSAFADQPISYPWRIDPSIVLLRGSPGFDAYAASGSPSTSFDGSLQWDGLNYVNKAGYEACGTCEQFWSYAYFDLTPVQGKQIEEAKWSARAWSTRGSGNFTMWAGADAWTPASVTWGSLPNHRNDAPARRDGTATAGQWAEVNVTDWVRRWLDPNGWPNYGMVINTAGQDSFVKFGAAEEPGNIPQISVSFNPGPSISIPPFFGAAETVTTTTPTLTGSTVPGMQYAFRVGTSADVDSAPVATSTLQGSPTWTVPAGVLRDGGVYYRKIYTFDGSAWASSPPKRFQVNRRLGTQNVSPMDPVGPVGVNLATGNVVYRHASPTFQTTGGPIGASFTYNSQAASNYGLSGAYSANCNGTQPWTKARPTARRHDIGSGSGSAWSMSFPGAPIPGSVDTDAFCVRWSGYLTVPYAATGSSYWSFGLTHDDGATILLDNNPVPYLNAGGVGTHWGGQLQFQTTQTVPITIELVDTGGPAEIALHVAGAENKPVPRSWLSLTPPVLPTGWSSSLDATGTVAYTSAVIDPGGSLVTLLGPGGEPSLFEADGSGQAWRPIGGDGATLTRNTAGDLVVRGVEGTTYVFDPRGKLRSASAGPDRTNFAAPTFEYDASGKLSKVREPLSNGQRYMQLVYSTGPGTCPSRAGFDSGPPSGHLCRINYTWDGTSTRLFYQGERLALIEEPGDPGAGAADGPQDVSFGYEGGGRLRSIREGLASDYVDRALRADNDLLRTVVDYVGERATSVVLPEPQPGHPRPAHSYRYVSASETQVDVAGLPQSAGFFRKVQFNGAGQVTADTDATNLATTQVWDGTNPTDQPLWKIDPSGLKTGYVHDVEGRLTEVHGPGPQYCFDDPGGDETNVVWSCTAYVPITYTRYDHHYSVLNANKLRSGLAATYWDGAAEFAGGDGRPDGEQVAFDAPGSTASKSWTPMTRPPGVATDQWSGRFTGQILIMVGDVITFRLDRHAQDKARLFIDDTLVVDGWNQGNPIQADFFVSEGYHRIRIDYVNTGPVPGGSSDATLTLSWFDLRPEQGIAGPVPNGYLIPSYGLVAETEDADEHVTAYEYADPTEGLVTAKVQESSSGTLRTEFGYAPTTGKPTWKRLPRQVAQGGPQVSYTHYGDNDVVPANECGETAVQAGFPKQTTEPSGVVRLHLYDERAGPWAARSPPTPAGPARLSTTGAGP